MSAGIALEAVCRGIFGAGNCQEGQGGMQKRCEKAAFLPKSGHFWARKKQIRKSLKNKHSACVRSVGLETHATAGREAGATVSCFAGRRSRWTTKKGSFFEVCGYWLINSKKSYPIDTMRLTRNFDAKNGWNRIGGWGAFTVSSVHLQGSVNSGQ
jgi:hypothetical protein